MPKFPNYSAGDVVFVRFNHPKLHKNHDLFTPTKIYACKVKRDNNRSGIIVTNDGAEHYILFEGCAHLGSKNWEVLSEKYYERFGALPPKTLIEDLYKEQ